ncbi:MAG: 5-formyltetrahydrofolate cyclo-ligase [Phycisphaerales bacterium]
MDVTKQQLRRDFKARRAAMSADEVTHASASIRRHLLALEQVRSAGSIFTYVSINNEPDTRALIRDLLALGKAISVPRIDADGRMHAHIIQNLNDLKSSGPEQYRTPIPSPDTSIETAPDVVILPGLAFTTSGKRLGMGGGHYDRYLADHPDAFAIALCYAWQVIDDLPAEPHDRPVKLLVTEAGLFPRQ